MDRKKPPVLTSPRKVGFLVALMLVVTGLGVGYFISGAFGLKWHWLELGGLSPTTWTFNLDAFIEEMVPLVALVTLLAVAAHVLVSGAVKRYTRYVDSGTEYKQLLKSIKTIDDLEDEERLEQLKQHPELREFLLGFKTRMAARERQLKEGERRPVASRENDGAARKLPAECGILVSAIMNGKAGFSGDLALTIPELKQIERAVRDNLPGDSAASAEVESLRSRINTTVEAVRNRSAGIRRDVDACVTGVREMEKMLAQLKKAIEKNQEAAVATEGISNAARQLDSMAEALTGLGEETRRIAIAAALEVSGGAEGQSIKVAEEVRTIATRFNAVAAQWKKAGPALRTGLSTIEKGVSSNGQRRKQLVASAAKATTLAQKWGERLVALQEQICELERAAGIQADVGESREWGAIDGDLNEYAPEETVEPDIHEEEDDSYEAPSVDEDDAVDEAEPEAVEEETVAGLEESGTESFENNAPPAVFEEEAGEDESQFADIPGFEKEQRVFNEGIAQTPGEPDDTGDGLEVEPESSDVYSEARHPAPSAEAAAEEPAPETSSHSDDGFLTGPRGKAPARKAAEPEAESDPAPRRRPPIKVVPVEVDTEPEEDGRIDIDAEVEEDADALDLYALGAVDFVEGVHA
ncbi:MAG: hypothetical protein OEX18_09760 [Candidatus Krumholzibacteria bacterium]|nr:hypothetical protein [Candidatus Krumholzibacteria bacterium]MDH4337544.1 hypothetical protein [Candidatus Krumholzibacteria bacterium]MDH5269929.1 hypothetical protein [Candidatus Krumholzibacteria bacterium]MDH5626676.1 hypothetical protein [Candidatus Krumholzibacteria bacterium]